jgi:hypothetical protein
MRRFVVLMIIMLFAAVLAACGSEGEPTPTKTPRPTATFTPLPTVAAVMPAVENNEPVESPPDTPTLPATGEQTSPLPTPADAVSPLVTPSPTPEVQPTATPTPGFEAQEPQPALAANLSCGEGCNAGNPEGVGLVMFNLVTGQLDTWVANLDPLEGAAYEGWLVEGSRAESTGRFNVRPDGTAGEFIVLVNLKDDPWSSFVLTVEPEPDDSPAPAAPHSIGGPLRRTTVGEAFYSRFDMPCQQCHGPAAEGGTGPALASTSLSFDEFLAAVRNHPGGTLTEEVVATRDLQHMYAWLTSIQP